MKPSDWLAAHETCNPGAPEWLARRWYVRVNQVVITSGTLSPLDLYPKLLGFNPVVRTALSMSTVRKCICPLVVTR